MIRQAMLLAAGLGTRMRPLTDAVAKPLLPLAGRALLDHALDRLAAAGVERVAVNAHWQAEGVAAHLRGRPGVRVLREESLLGTGGAVRAALDVGALHNEPFYVVNGDSYWLDGPTPALARLAGAWKRDQDAVLLLHRTFQVHAEVGTGEFALDPLGFPRRAEEKEIVPYVFAGVQLAAPAAFAGVGAFGASAAWDRMMEAGRLRAVVHDGLWFHLSRPGDLMEAEAALRAGLVGDSR